jgi:SAM-dependent methyltransferase
VTEGIWDARAEAYRQSEAHASGPDLDLLVEWAEGAETALDVASGGGHVARRLREAGLDVVTVDPAPGMRADVQAFAEDLPFDDRSFEVVACRVAAHHFADVEAAMHELARVAAGRVLVVDNLNMGGAAEEAERLRDPSHVRNYDEAEWRALYAGAGLELEDVRVFDRPIDLAAWLERAGCTGNDARRVRELMAEHVDGDRIVLRRIALEGRRP